MFDKVPTHVLSDSVAQQLLDKIETGVFGTGSKLPSEAMLSEAFGVSRSVVREAISRLKNEGSADVAFHRAIAQATGNPYFLKTLEFVSQYLEAATRITRTNEAGRADFSRQVHEEHQAVVAAIRLGDPLAAGHAARAHIYNAARRLRLAGVE